MDSGSGLLTEGDPGCGSASRGPLNLAAPSHQAKDLASHHQQNWGNSKCPGMVLLVQMLSRVSSLNKSSPRWGGGWFLDPKQILIPSILLLGQTWGQELCLSVLPSLGPPRPGPFIQAPELWWGTCNPCCPQFLPTGGCWALAFSVFLCVLLLFFPLYTQ